MGKELLYNGKIITMEDHIPRVGAVLIEDGIIKKVGLDCDFHNIEEESVKKLDLKGKVLMPGFVGCVKFGIKEDEKEKSKNIETENINTSGEENVDKNLNIQSGDIYKPEKVNDLENSIDNEDYEKVETLLRAYVKKQGITTLILINITYKQYEVLRKISKRIKDILDITVYIRYKEAVEKLERFSKPNNIYNEGIRIAGCSLELDKYSEQEILLNISKCLENNWQIFGMSSKEENIKSFCNAYTKAQELEQSDYRQRPILEIRNHISEEQLDELNLLEINPLFFEDIYEYGDYYFREESVFLRQICPLNATIIRGIKCAVYNEDLVKKNNNSMIRLISNVVNRNTKTGRIIEETEKLSIPNALDTVTKNPIYQIFEEKNKGSVAVGKVADFVILDRSPYEVRKDSIDTINVLGVIKQGIVY